MDLLATIAASSLTARQRAMDVTADNFANANTPGYKEHRVQFSDWLSRQHGTTIAFTQDRATWREQQAGTVSHTGNPLDVALPGDGYFTVSTPHGPRLTRDGRFGLLPDGRIGDGSGNPLLDTNGQPVRVSPADTTLTVSGDGTLSSENGQLAKIGVVTPSDPMRLTAEGGTLFRADTPTKPAIGAAVVQGAVEDSNVQPVVELTRMMDGLRQFQFVSQFVQADNDRQQQAIDRLLPANG
jgi:flagellar basal-body rod protein FlgF